MALDFRPASPSDDEEVAAFVQQHPQSLLAHTRLGAGLVWAGSGGRWEPQLHVAYDGPDLVAILPLAVARFGPVRIARSEGGPLLKPDRLVLLPEVLQWASRSARDRRCVRLELRLYFAEQIDGEPVPEAQQVLSILTDAGFRRPPGPHKGTYWVHLDEDEPLLEAFSSKCRRDVRKGLREGVTVAPIDGADTLAVFERLYGDMCSRKKLDGRRKQYFREGVAVCLQAGLARLYASYYDGKICNVALVSMAGLPTYWLGAASPVAYEKGVPPTGQVLQFGIMQHLRDAGHTCYDLGGSPGPIPQKGHPNYGVWKFKHEFGAPFVHFLDLFEQVLSPAGDRLYRLARRIRRLIST